MVALVSTVAYLGLEARTIEVQCQISAGVPAFIVVGLPDKAVAESRERVRAAIAALGLSLPPKRITVNLSPADLPKEGSHYDLPIALALLDQDTSVWLSPELAIPPVVDYLRFHTGCRLATDCGAADFALVHSAQELPGLALFNQGSDEFPERSTAVVLQMTGLGNDPMWELSGPGIEHRRSLSVAPDSPNGGLSNTTIGGSDFASSFALHWKQNHLRFPCGIDLFFASGHQLCALPRSTRISD